MLSRYLGFYSFLEIRERERERGEGFFPVNDGAKIRGNVTLRVEKFDEGINSPKLWYGIEKRIGTLSLLEAFDLGDGYNEKLRGSWKWSFAAGLTALSVVILNLLDVLA